MQTVRFFSDYAGRSVEVDAPQAVTQGELSELFPGFLPRTTLVGIHNGRRRPVTRIIHAVATTKPHRCNAKCLNGRPDGVCECACGGVNHGLASVVMAGVTP